jgi:hypothetical protein
MTPLYIFDLDGTLAKFEHRMHFIDCRDAAPDWNAFYEACDADEPNWPVIGTLMQLYAVGTDIMIWSGRSDAVRVKTIAWLSQYLNIRVHVLAKMLTMRAADNRTPSDQLKRKWLNLMQPEDRRRLVATFEDRQKDADMFRGEGVTCFMVAADDNKDKQK